MALPDWAVIVGMCVGICASVVSFFKVKPEARKMDHDGAAAITTASGAIVTAVQGDLAALRKEVAELTAWRKRTERFGRAHMRWDDIVAAQSRAAGNDVPDPPPLYPEDD